VLREQKFASDRRPSGGFAAIGGKVAAGEKSEA
jgi:hypothetical protein